MEFRERRETDDSMGLGSMGSEGSCVSPSESSSSTLSTAARRSSRGETLKEEEDHREDERERGYCTENAEATRREKQRREEIECISDESLEELMIQWHLRALLYSCQ